MLADSDFALICYLVAFGFIVPADSDFSTVLNHDLLPESFDNRLLLSKKLHHIFRQVDAGPKAADASPPRLGRGFVKNQC